jgi:hypothetical protein
MVLDDGGTHHQFSLAFEVSIEEGDGSCHRQGETLRDVVIGPCVRVELDGFVGGLEILRQCL